MDFVTLETPSARVPLSRQAFQLVDTAFGIVLPSELLEVIPNELIQALSQGIRFAAGASNQLLING